MFIGFLEANDRSWQFYGILNSMTTISRLIILFSESFDTMSLYEKILIRYFFTTTCIHSFIRS